MPLKNGHYLLKNLGGRDSWVGANVPRSPLAVPLELGDRLDATSFLITRKEGDIYDIKLDGYLREWNVKRKGNGLVIDPLAKNAPRLIIEQGNKEDRYKIRLENEKLYLTFNSNSWGTPVTLEESNGEWGQVWTPVWLSDV